MSNDYVKYKEKYKKRARDWYKNFKSTCSEDEMRKRLDRGIEAKRRIREKHAIRRRFLQMKLGGKCLKCGCDDWRLLDFDHIDPMSKSMNISQKIHMPLDFLSIEISKCQLLCANCHRLKTMEQGGFSSKIRKFKNPKKNSKI